MENIVTYTRRALDRFEERPFCTVDSLILSWISYMRLSEAEPLVYTWEGAPLRDLYRAEAFPALFSDMLEGADSETLLSALAASPRFRDIRVCGYTEHRDEVREMQFSAVTFRLTDEMTYIAFRGTDTTLLGWKEDFNMSFRCPVPSQEEARRYTEAAACQCEGLLLLGGHSKGGNLAVYAGAQCSDAVFSRIGRIYSHDGPGFQEKVLNTPAFRRASAKVDKTIPQGSIVGMLLEQQADYRVVKSREFSIWQHNPFSWVVEGEEFCWLDHIERTAEYFDRTLTDWLSNISDAERERFVDALYGVLRTSDAETLTDLRTDWPQILKSATQLDGDTRDFLIRTLRDLAVVSLRNMARPDKS